MRAATTAFRAGRLPDSDYRNRAEAFWGSMGLGSPAGSVPSRSAAPSPLPGAHGASPVEASLADRLADLGRLHAEGILTDEEFRAAKRRLLADERGTQARQEGA
jgi:hypothetical protein